MASNGTLADEAALLRVCLTALGIGPRQVVDELTNLGHTSTRSAEDLQKTARWLRTELKELEEETLADFVAKNSQAHSVFPSLTLDGQLIPVAYEDLLRTLQDDEGWERFRATYPESCGYVEFSRVGFNAALTQALVYTGVHKHLLMGEGMYSLFAKDETTWTGVGHTLSWIS